MASIYKKNNKWVAEVRRKGFYQSKRFPNKAQATTWALEVEGNLNGASMASKNKTLRECIERYGREVTPKKKGKRWELIRLNKFLRHPIADKVLNTIERNDIINLREEMLETLSPGSVNRELTVLRSIFVQIVYEWEWLKESPFERVKLPKKPPPRDRRISDDEIERILKALFYEEENPVKTQRDEIAVAFLLALETAMRQGEIWKLTWEHVHLKDKYVTLPDTKNGTKRDVPLSTRAVELLKKMKNIRKDRVFFERQESAGVIFKRAVKLAGIEDLTFHDTRHEALTRLSKKIDVLDLARMVGHRDLRSLMIYYNPTASEIADRLG